MYWAKTPSIIKLLFSSLTWEIPNDNKDIYLTFDDGPEIDVTDKLLDILKTKNVKATFFCLGKNIEKNSALFERLKNEGHTVANHGYEHLNALNTAQTLYFDNIKKSEKYFDNRLFRPPYGKLKFWQWKPLSKKYDIVLWGILSGDFDPKISAQQCLDRVLKNLVTGSIIVFHDNQHSKAIMLNVVPKLIDEARKLGYNFRRLEFSRIDNLTP